MVVPDGQTNGHSNGDAGAEPQRAPGLSFAGIAGRGRPRPSLAVHGPAAAARRESISGFGEASQAPAAAPDKPVIPKLENTFVVGRPSDRGRQRNPNRFIPDRADAAPVAVEERFEVAVEEEAGPVTYGLSLAVARTEVVAVAGRDGSPGAGPSDAAAAGGGGGGAVDGGGAANGGALSVTSRDWEARKLREDLPRLADDPDLDQYEAMPVEMFGEAMLRGMGWEAGKGVGRNNVVVVPKEYVPRPGRLGLGAEPAAMLTKAKKYIKPGESREAKPDMVYLDADGNQRYTKGVDEKLVARQRRGAAPGKAMYIEGGRHSGFFCTVLAVEPEAGGRPAAATVRLQRSDTTVTVRCSDLIETSEAKASREAEAVRKRDAARVAARQDREEDRREGQPGAVPPERDGERGAGAANGREEGETDRKAAKKEAKREAKKERKREKESKKERHRDDDPPPIQKRRRSEEASAAASTDPPWLAAEIRVRIIDKGLRGGALYLKKGVVADVHQPTVCDLIVDGARVSNVSQAQLETVIPKEGGKVLVLAGPHAREVGRVMHKAKGAAAVQLLSDHSVLKVVYEDVSEYLGQDHD